ncbi:uncharacterized protein I303_108169 [Kwoniella dejecticola CBS 10117]|uniref:Uncharacterized protein n=1 Tax=Kwoniella dejecticola CBS 10117 TaxID=1296121 RepID=A0A1A5ZY77_9TREE|nr:uncharacterized protein I303_07505 [Kwoniella dejecticola CBS 10117]OBR82738.1 hypothetical protein I303_07505 [Kwoniella dejecticola CBS 10117]
MFDKLKGKKKLKKDYNAPLDGLYQPHDPDGYVPSSNASQQGSSVSQQGLSRPPPLWARSSPMIDGSTLTRGDLERMYPRRPPGPDLWHPSDGPYANQNSQNSIPHPGYNPYVRQPQPLPQQLPYPGRPPPPRPSRHQTFPLFNSNPYNPPPQTSDGNMLRPAFTSQPLAPHPNPSAPFPEVYHFECAFCDTRRRKYWKEEFCSGCQRITPTERVRGP